MTREVLLKTFKNFESQPNIEEVKIEDRQTIKNDLNRMDFRFSKLHKSYLVCKLYLFSLEKTFHNLPIVYFQGMMEIAVVIFDAYFQDKASSFRQKHKDKDENAPVSIDIDSISENEKALFDGFLSDNADLYKRFKNCLVNILNDKFLFFTRNDFEKYNEYNDIFIKMMKSKFKKDINSISSMKYMNHTLTFFKRLSENSDVVFKLLNIILNSDPSIVFSILAVYIEKADNFNPTNFLLKSGAREKMLITSLDEKDIKRIIDTHEIFQKTRHEMKNENKSKKSVVFLSTAAGCALIAIMISMWRNGSSDRN